MSQKCIIVKYADSYYRNGYWGRHVFVESDSAAFTYTGKQAGYRYGAYPATDLLKTLDQMKEMNPSVGYGIIDLDTNETIVE